MTPIDSAVPIVQNGKVYMKVYKNGEFEVVDPTPQPYAFCPAKYEINTQARMERTDFRAFDTEESVKRYIFKMPSYLHDFRTRQEAKSITVYEADRKYTGVWMEDNSIECTDYLNYASWDTEEDDSHGQASAETANVPIIAIGLIYKGEKIAWTYNPVSGKGNCSSEAEVLKNTAAFLKENKITLLKGWNSREWDVPFFTKRMAYNHLDFDYSSVRFLDLSLAYRFMEKNFRSQWGLGKVGPRFFGEKKPSIHIRITSLPDEELRRGCYGMLR